LAEQPDTSIGDAAEVMFKADRKTHVRIASVALLLVALVVFIGVMLLV
jgi:hypothetical protein